MRFSSIPLVLFFGSGLGSGCTVYEGDADASASSTVGEGGTASSTIGTSAPSGAASMSGQETMTGQDATSAPTTVDPTTAGNASTTDGPSGACADLSALCELLDDGGCAAISGGVVDPAADAEIAEQCHAASAAPAFCEAALDVFPLVCDDPDCHALALLCAQDCVGIYECSFTDFANCSTSLKTVGAECAAAVACSPQCTATETCVAEVCEPDADGDGVQDSVDNCPDTANPDQDDSNGDGSGDACLVAEEFFDVDTGLTWMNSGVPWLRYDEAVEFCEDTKHAGADNWRLPNIDELRSLVKGCPPLEPGGACQVTTSCNTESCFEKQSGYMWCDNPGCSQQDGACFWPDGMLDHNGDASCSWPNWSTTVSDFTPAGTIDSRWVMNFTGWMGSRSVCPTCDTPTDARCVR